MGSNNWIISRNVAFCTLCLLTLWELMQLTSKIVNGQFREFFGWQNMIEGLMISLTFAFFTVQRFEYCPLHNSIQETEELETTGKIREHTTKSGAQAHLLGW